MYINFQILDLSTCICGYCKTIYGIFTPCPWCYGKITYDGSCSDCEFILYNVPNLSNDSKKPKIDSTRNINVPQTIDQNIDQNVELDENIVFYRPLDNGNALYKNNGEFVEYNVNDISKNPIVCHCCNTIAANDNQSFCELCGYTLKNNCRECNVTLRFGDDIIDENCWKCGTSLFKR